MKKPLIGLLCALSALSASFAHADQNVFTPTNGPACADHSPAEFGWWRCRGPGRYVAEFADEGNLAAVSIWMPSHAPKATRSFTWRGAVAFSAKSFTGESTMAGRLLRFSGFGAPTQNRTAKSGRWKLLGGSLLSCEKVTGHI
jgi:hypothetical protein